MRVTYLTSYCVKSSRVISSKRFIGDSSEEILGSVSPARSLLAFTQPSELKRMSELVRSRENYKQRIDTHWME